MSLIILSISRSQKLGGQLPSDYTIYGIKLAIYYLMAYMV